MKATQNIAINHNDIEVALESEIFQNREIEKSHTRYASELRFLNLVKNGEVELLHKYLANHTPDTIGNMSRNPLRQEIYEFIAAITLVTRFSIEGGLGEEEAYHLSDVYIQKVDICTSSQEIWPIHCHMVIDFATRVRTIKKNSQVSASIQSIKDYIFNHLHYKISLGELAKFIGFTPTYLSYLFRQETGDTITEFLHRTRVTEAESLLRNTEYSPAEISQYLGFCSQSHFSSIFRKYTGKTPTQFRKTYYRRNWNDISAPQAID